VHAREAVKSENARQGAGGIWPTLWQFCRRAAMLSLTLRLRPHDTSTPEGRSKERYRRVGLTALSSAVAKGISILTGLISAPLTIHYLGTERYGLWMTISSVIVMMGFADLGIGNGLVNAIITAAGNDDREDARRHVSNAFFLFLLIAAAILCGFALAYPHLPWSRMFNVASPLAVQETGPAIAIFIVCFAIGLPLGTVQRVQMGYQEGFQNNLWQCLGSIVGLVAVVLVIRLRLGLPALVLAMSGSSSAIVGVNWFVQFFHFRPWLWPRWRDVRWASSIALLGSGLLFFTLQLATLIGTASDNVVLAQIDGPKDVAVYSITQKLFSITLLMQFVIAPLWPALGDALERGEYGWARVTVVRVLAISILLTLLATIPMVGLGKWIIAVWIGKNVVPPVSLLLAMAFWSVLGIYGGVMSVLLNNRTLLKKQAIFFTAASLSALLLKVLLTPRIGVSGVVWATNIAYCLFYVGPAGLLVRRELSKPDDPQPDGKSHAATAVVH
jgi:O-antigen/teichoic acid export membrane protein